MWITVPASAPGGPELTSVLDLEPLLAYARQCRPDAVSLMPPPGADDLPNGAALAALKDRLEKEGLRVVAGCWEVPSGAPFLDPAWQAQTLFELRALVTALGEAGVEPLTLTWPTASPDPASQDGMRALVGSLLEEAERAGVRLAVGSGMFPDPAAFLEQIPSPWLGICWEAGGSLSREAAVQQIGAFGERLFTVRAEAVGLAARLSAGPGREGGGLDWPPALRALEGGGFAGPVLLSARHGPAEYAWAVGYLQGLLRAGDP
jgi:sugar phosphate isomerase/epimerase